MLDIDQWAGDSLGHQRDSAAGPLSASMRFDEVTVSESGEVSIPEKSYEPLLMIAPARDLEDETWRIGITRVIPGPQTVLDSVWFAPFSEKDGYVACLSPAVGPSHLLAKEIRLRIQVERDGIVLSHAQSNELLRIRYAEGRFAKLLAVLQQETTRTRRLAREIAARRTLPHARGFLLDRMGRELAVPRLDNEIQIVGDEILVKEQRETDEAYRNRLSIYRPFFMATRRSVLGRLNGESSALRRVGGPSNFDVVERDNPFTVAIKVFGVGDDEEDGRKVRLRYLQYLRDTTLIDPEIDVPDARHLPLTSRKLEQSLRLRLRKRLHFQDPDKRSMAPWLARSFDRVIRCLAHLGIDDAMRVQRCQDADAGSRFELGLSAELHRLPPAMVDAIRNAIQAGAARAPNDLEVQGLLNELAATDLRDDDASWLFRACGFRTFVKLSDDRMLLSHISQGHLQLQGTDGTDLGSARKGLPMQAILTTPKSGLDVALANALAGGADGWPAGMDDWSVVAVANTAAELDSLADPGLPQQLAFEKMGIRVPRDVASFARTLKSYPSQLFRILTLGAPLAATLSANDSTATDRLGLIADALGANGASSLALLKGSGSLVLIVSSIGLPLIGTNIGPRRSSDFFWSTTTISGGQTFVRGQGTRSFATAIGRGVYAVTSLAYSRIGDTDPFEWRVTLPDDQMLDHPQYEILMNMLERMYPIGVEINTWDIRRRHVALDANSPAPLSPHLSRSYRPFRRPRFVGSGDARKLPPSR